MNSPALRNPAEFPPPPPVVQWDCPACNASLGAAEPGQQGPCPVCGTMVRAPGHAVPALPIAEEGTSSLVPTGSAKGSRLRRAVALSAVLVASGALALAWWAARATRQTAGAEAAAGHVAAADSKATRTLELRMVLNRFLQERTWAAKRQVVLEPDRFDALGPAYYHGRDPDEIRAADFDLVELPETRSVDGVHALRAERPGQRPVIALFKRVGSAWKLDWEMFTQTYDSTLAHFVATPDFAMRTLKARVSRAFTPAGGSPVFLIEVSDFLDHGQRIEIELPVATPQMREIAAGLEGTAERPATVEVCWIRPGPGGECVPALQRLVCWGWRGVTGQPVPAAPAVEAREFSLPPSAPRDIPTRTQTENPVAASAPEPVAVAGGG